MASAAAAMRDSTFRTSPHYDLVLFDRLADHERAALADLRTHQDFYGILRPRNGAPDGALSPSLRAVDRETALLLLTMRDPGRLPSYALEGDPSGDEVRRLVLDGFLEISDGSSFVSGRRAAPLVLASRGRTSPRHRLAQLSWDAVEYGAALRADDRGVLSMKLYGFNRIPLTAAHAARYPDAPAILDSVVDDDRLRAHGWGVTIAKSGHWINFSREVGPRRPSTTPEHGGCKLYVSPAPASTAEAFPVLLDALEACGVRNFKMAGTAAGLLRPDKLVAYCDDRATLMGVADRLAEELQGLPAHGVPFTSAIDADGLLSWGADPPPDARPLSWQPQQSWRSWITDALAGALIDARGDGAECAMSPAQFAVQRLEFEGVDVDRWAPAPTVWRDDVLPPPVARP